MPFFVNESENNKQNCSEGQAKTRVTGENKTQSPVYLTSNNGGGCHSYGS